MEKVKLGDFEQQTLLLYSAVLLPRGRGENCKLVGQAEEGRVREECRKEEGCYHAQSG